MTMTVKGRDASRSRVTNTDQSSSPTSTNQATIHPSRQTSYPPQVNPHFAQALQGSPSSGHPPSRSQQSRMAAAAANFGGHFYDVWLGQPVAVMPLPPPPYSTLPHGLPSRHRPPSPPRGSPTLPTTITPTRADSPNQRSPERRSRYRRVMDSLANLMPTSFSGTNSTNNSSNNHRPSHPNHHHHNHQSSSSSSLPTTTTAEATNAQPSTTQAGSSQPTSPLNNNEQQVQEPTPLTTSQLPSYHAAMYAGTTMSPASMRRRRRRLLRAQRLESTLLASTPTMLVAPESPQSGPSSNYLTENKKYLVFVSLFILGIVLTFVGVVTLSLFTITFGFTFIFFSLILYKLLPSSKFAPRRLRSSIMGLTSEGGIIGRGVNSRRSPILVPHLPRSHPLFTGHGCPPTHHLQTLHHPIPIHHPQHLHHLPPSLHHPYVMSPSVDGLSMSFALPPPPPTYQEAIAMGGSNLIQPLDAGILNERATSAQATFASQSPRPPTVSQSRVNEVTVSTSPATTSIEVSPCPVVTVDCPGYTSPDVVTSTLPPPSNNVVSVNIGGPSQRRSRIDVTKEDEDVQSLSTNNGNNNNNRLHFVTIIEATI